MSNQITIYHGSQKKIIEPKFGFGKKDNDYGRGFYCTEDKELAKEWAVQRGNNGFLNIYKIDIDGLNIYKLNEKPYTIFHWLNILVENRGIDDIDNLEAIKFLKKNYHIDKTDADIIIGYRADDSYFTFTRDFLNDAITLETLSKAIVLGKLGLQIMINSEKAFERLQFVGFENVDKIIYGKKFFERDIIARETYRTIKKEPKSKGILLTELIKMTEVRRNRIIKPFGTRSD